MEDSTELRPVTWEHDLKDEREIVRELAALGSITQEMLDNDEIRDDLREAVQQGLREQNNESVSSWRCLGCVLDRESRT